MLAKMLRFAVAVAWLAPTTLFAAEPQSAALATQLSTLLTAQKLDAIAAKDPAAEDRFVAALFYPGSQLLVVSGQYASPPLLQRSLDAKAYRDVYLALQQSATPASKVFVQDMGADGLHATDDQATDILYEHVTDQTIFNGTPGRGQDEAYAKKLAEADAAYSQMLQVLITAAQAS